MHHCVYACLIVTYGTIGAIKDSNNNKTIVKKDGAYAFSTKMWRVPPQSSTHTQDPNKCAQDTIEVLTSYAYDAHRN